MEKKEKKSQRVKFDILRAQLKILFIELEQFFRTSKLQLSGTIFNIERYDLDS